MKTSSTTPTAVGIGPRPSVAPTSSGGRAPLSLPSLRGVGCVAALAVLSASLVGCGGDDLPYKPKPANTGKKASLPAVPTLPTKAKKVGDAYTVYGLVHDLRSKVHLEDVNNKKVTLVGYVVKTNFGDAPKCAVHKTGKGDSADCNAPVPAFWVADDKAEKKDMIDVMGFASNFAQLFTIIEAIDKAPKGKEGEVKLKDELWQVDLPNPLPDVGAKVKLTGTYGFSYNKSTGGAASNPKYGILTVEKIEYVEPPTTKVHLPGMKEKK